MEVVLTGTGIPLAAPDRAGPGTFVRAGGMALQFDAGRATVLRLTALDVRPFELDTLFVTHHHSDHLLGFDDLVITRWMPKGPPLEVISPRGQSSDFIEGFMDRWGFDIRIRQEHTGRTDDPEIVSKPFDSSPVASRIWERGDVRVSSIEVRHLPVKPAVAYRVDAPEGAVVISGDTIVCPEVESLATGAAVLVHEVVRRRLMAPIVPGTVFEKLLDYHADSFELGAMAQRIGVPTLVLTHLAPPPRTDEDLKGFVDDVREGGYTGELVIGPDLTSVMI